MYMARSLANARQQTRRLQRHPLQLRRPKNIVKKAYLRGLSAARHLVVNAEVLVVPEGLVVQASVAQARSRGVATFVSLRQTRHASCPLHRMPARRKQLRRLARKPQIWQYLVKTIRGFAGRQLRRALKRVCRPLGVNHMTTTNVAARAFSAKHRKQQWA